MSNIVAIVGRPNVGKSTFFNRLVGTRDAIVDEVSGVTRDRHYGRTEWNGREFSVIDTGGYVTNSDDVFENEIRRQVMLAMNEADVVLFLVDVNSGVTDLDDAVAQMLRKTNKTVILVANKVDTNQQRYYAHDFYSLGLGEVFCISSINGSGTGDLLDAVVASFKKTVDDEEKDDIPRITIVGRPNVGKSSLINSLLDEDRTIVTPIAGTTRDTIDIRYNKYGHDFYLIDTAGLRKKGKTMENLEFYSVMRSIRAIEKSDVCLLMIDATRGVEAQDMSIFKLTERNRKGIVILVNKWDIYEKEQDTVKKFTEIIKKRIEPFKDVPILFVSATTKLRINKALDLAVEVYKNRKRKVATSELNKVMLPAIEKHPPPAYKGKFIKIKYVTQLPTYAPSFAFYCNLPQYIKEPYRRYLENRIRENFSFSGVPIQVLIRKK